MKSTLALSLACALASVSQAQFNQPLTNDVPILQSGMRLGLCESTYLFERDTKGPTVFEKKQLDAASELIWILHDPSTNRFSTVVFLGMSNSFSFELKTTNGAAVPKTSKGKAMSAGPRSLTDLSRSARRIGPAFRDFPRLTELFNFPSNGVYVLEFRYWTWNGDERRFALSDPVRLQVVKRTGNR